jgi:hypothetical protein
MSKHVLWRPMKPAEKRVLTAKIRDLSLATSRPRPPALQDY